MEKLFVTLMILLAVIMIVLRIRRTLTEGSCSGCSGDCSECLYQQENSHYIDLTRIDQKGEEKNEYEAIKGFRTW